MNMIFEYQLILFLSRIVFSMSSQLNSSPPSYSTSPRYVPRCLAISLPPRYLAATSLLPRFRYCLAKVYYTSGTITIILVIFGAVVGLVCASVVMNTISAAVVSLLQRVQSRSRNNKSQTPKAHLPVYIRSLVTTIHVGYSVRCIR